MMTWRAASQAKNAAQKPPWTHLKTTYSGLEDISMFTMSTVVNRGVPVGCANRATSLAISAAKSAMMNIVR
jgi:hypothetical protein